MPGYKNLFQQASSWFTSEKSYSEICFYAQAQVSSHTNSYHSSNGFNSDFIVFLLTFLIGFGQTFYNSQKVSKPGLAAILKRALTSLVFCPEYRPWHVLPDWGSCLDARTSLLIVWSRELISTTKEPCFSLVLFSHSKWESIY